MDFRLNNEWIGKKEKNMLFSVVVPAYNAERLIGRCIDSILGQSFQDFELIVVNDGSKDHTLEAMAGYQDARLKVITQPNQGVSVARNTGIQAARGDYICFLDADDEFLPHCLEEYRRAIDAFPEKGFFASRHCVGLLDGSVTEVAETGRIEYAANAFPAFIKDAEVVWTGCVCIRRALFDQYGMFEPGVPIGEDRDMWIRLFAHTGVVFCDRVTARRNRDGSEATKFYERRTKADILNRLDGYLQDPTISDDVKRGLQEYYECEKMVIVRTFLIQGKKKEAWQAMKKIDKAIIPPSRLLSTSICFFIPSALIRGIIAYKNKGLFR